VLAGAPLSGPIRRLRWQEWAEQERQRRQQPEPPSMRTYRQLQILEQIDNGDAVPRGRKPRGVHFWNGRDGMERKIHARYERTNENLCGKAGPSLERWTETAEEITRPDCNAKIHRFTADELNAGIDAALRQLKRSEQNRF